MKKIFLLLLIGFSFSSCEKDDICSETTPTTPKVIVEFYDISSPATLKNVTKLRIERNGTDNALTLNETLSSNDPGRYLSNGNKVSIPLKTFEDISDFEFKFNYADAAENTDILTFNYTRKTEYVSRACGYKTLFTLNTSNPVVLTADGNNWIQNITVTQPNIENENETHVKIYF